MASGQTRPFSVTSSGGTSVSQVEPTGGGVNGPVHFAESPRHASNFVLYSDSVSSVKSASLKATSLGVQGTGVGSLQIKPSDPQVSPPCCGGVRSNLSF